ncbi:thioredoxin-like 4B, isoform CRA_a, partial [Rattus norvegicus]
MRIPSVCSWMILRKEPGECRHPRLFGWLVGICSFCFEVLSIETRPHALPLSCALSS